MSRACAFCSVGEGGYTCPRCHLDYCGLQCYQAASHADCSEQFYKDCVKAELVGDNLSGEAREKMQKILARMNQEEDSEEEVLVDSDDDEEEVNLEQRLQGVDLNDPEKIWDALSASEKREFNELLEKGDVSSILPDYTPWWNYRIDTPCIQELDAPADESFKERCPKVWEEIPSFKQIFPGKPSDSIKYGVLNLLYGYAYAVRLMYGDYGGSCLEFVSIVEALSGEFGSLAGVNFDLADTAVEAAASAVNINSHLAVSLEFSRSVKKDVYQIVKGPSPDQQQYYLLASLSDLRQLYLQTVKEAKKPRQEAKRPSRFDEKPPDVDLKKLKAHLKKIEFYLAWSKEHCAEYAEL